MATPRAVPATAFGMLDLVVDLGCLDIKSSIHHLPRSGQAENSLIEDLRLKLVRGLRGKDVSFPTELPTEISEGPRR